MIQVKNLRFQQLLFSFTSNILNFIIHLEVYFYRKSSKANIQIGRKRNILFSEVLYRAINILFVSINYKIFLRRAVSIVAIEKEKSIAYKFRDVELKL